MKKLPIIIFYFLFIKNTIAQEFNNEIKLQYQHYFDNKDVIINQQWLNGAIKIRDNTALNLNVKIDAISSATPSAQTTDAVTSASPSESMYRNEFNLDIQQRIKNSILTLGGTLDYKAKMLIVGIKQMLFDKRTSISANANISNNERVRNIVYNPFEYDSDNDFVSAEPGIGDGYDRYTFSSKLQASYNILKNTCIKIYWAISKSSDYNRGLYYTVLVQDGMDGGLFYMESYPTKRYSNALKLYIKQKYHLITDKCQFHFGWRRYFDSWELNSNTIETEIQQYLHNNFSFTGRYRYYTQNRAYFFRDSYSPKHVDPANSEFLPYITSDERLGEYDGHLLSILLKYEIQKSTTFFIPSSIYCGTAYYFNNINRNEIVRNARYELIDNDEFKATSVHGGLDFSF